MLMPANLRPETVDRLHELIRINRESRNCYQAAADEVDDPQLAALFQDLARQRRTFAEELEGYVDATPPATEPRSGPAETIYRWWQELRARLTGGQVYAVLADAERNEDEVRDLYAQAIEDAADARVAPVLHEQYMLIRGDHDRIRALRDYYRDNAA